MSVVHYSPKNMTNSDGASAAPQSASNRRSVKTILIHRPMQKQFTLITIAIMMFSALVINFLIHHTLREVIMDNVGRLGRIGDYNMLSDVSFVLIVRVTMILFATIIAVGMFGVFFLHRVAGPAYRFQQLFKRLSQNEIPGEFQLRDKDFFKELATDLNLTFKMLHKRKKAMAELESILATISDQGLPSEARQKLGEIKTILQDIKQSPA